MSDPLRPSSSIPFAAACLLVAIQAGCTSALTTTYLRDGLWNGPDQAADEESAADDAGPADATTPEPESTVAAPDPVVDRERREAALAEAMNRLARLGTLDAGTEAALVATLQRTEPEDWPVVVEEFATTLAEAGAATAPPPAATPDGPEPAEPAPDVAAPPTAKPVAEPAGPSKAMSVAAPVAASETVAAAESAAATDAPPTTAGADAPAAVPQEPARPAAEPAAAPPALAVRSACFASAVRAWGDIDRFTADRFLPGQEVIVYVELDNIASGESPSGHTTCIDASLKLVDEAGQTLHAWNFDPLAETRAGRRRDYFARYVICIPESAPPGGCRVELAVTDTIGGATATAALPLEIAAAE